MAGRAKENGNKPAESNVNLITAFKVEVKVSQSYVRDNVAGNTKYISEKLNVNRKTIQRDIAYLQERKLIQWVGSDKTGHWEIIAP